MRVYRGRSPCKKIGVASPQILQNRVKIRLFWLFLQPVNCKIYKICTRKKVLYLLYVKSSTFAQN